MWEYCICFNSGEQADTFERKVVDYIKSLKGIIVNVCTQGYFKVLIAIPSEYANKTTTFLAEKIAEIILLFYKKEYILNNLTFEKVHSINMNVFLQTLVCFDSDMDKKIIIERMAFKKNFYLNSFIEFKLPFLKKKWNELITLANDNIMYLLSDDSFLELIKFLISNLEHRCYAVNVFSKKDCYLLCDIEGKVINDFLLEKNIIYDDTKLLTSLIALNPEKIIIHCNSFLKDNLIKKLYKFFSNRIEICK